MLVRYFDCGRNHLSLSDDNSFVTFIFFAFYSFGPSQIIRYTGPSDGRLSEAVKYLTVTACLFFLISSSLSLS